MKGKINTTKKGVNAQFTRLYMHICLIGIFGYLVTLVTHGKDNRKIFSVKD